ncbi:MAG: septal ring lytic transglycosylase RlpA family protein [Aquificae bacterium]|nr:septal ring lytic transglycosylase RlpA family protein [Aquificota bacterium]
MGVWVAVLLSLALFVWPRSYEKPDAIESFYRFRFFLKEEDAVKISEKIRVKENCRVEKGLASWYGGRFHGRKTANGERFDLFKYTAASRTLPLGTYVLVVNLENGRFVVVRINDRGPYVDGRIIDLSMASAMKLGMVRKGIARVAVIPLECLSHATQKRLFEELIADIIKSF